MKKVDCGITFQIKGVHISAKEDVLKAFEDDTNEMIELYKKDKQELKTWCEYQYPDAYNRWDELLPNGVTKPFYQELIALFEIFGIFPKEEDYRYIQELMRDWFGESQIYPYKPDEFWNKINPIFDIKRDIQSNQNLASEMMDKYYNECQKQGYIIFDDLYRHKLYLQILAMMTDKRWFELWTTRHKNAKDKQQYYRDCSCHSWIALVRIYMILSALCLHNTNQRQLTVDLFLRALVPYSNLQSDDDHWQQYIQQDQIILRCMNNILEIAKNYDGKCIDEFKNWFVYVVTSGLDPYSIDTTIYAI